MPRPPPRAILLATDLSARCDRARDRALQLARQWRARLVALTVAPPGRDSDIRDETLGIPGWASPEPPAAAARRALALDFEDAGVEVRTRIGTGDVAPTVRQVAEEEGCGLVVTGIARNEAFRPPVLGSTIDWLARHSPMPVLVVHDRSRGPYGSVAVASDLSPAARLALETAAACFADAAGFALVHGVDAPTPLRTRTPEALAADAREQALDRIAAHLAEADLTEDLRARIRTVAEGVEPARLVDLYARTHGADLVVLGNHGRSALLDLLIGSVARRILESVRSDTLIVPVQGSRG